MKITKNQLKQIIKEEFEAVITQEGLFDMFKSKESWAKDAKPLPGDGEILQQIADLQAAGMDIDVPTEQELATMRVGDSDAYYALENQLTAAPGGKPLGTSKLIQAIYAFREKQSDADYARRDAADDKVRASAAAEKKRAGAEAASAQAEKDHYANQDRFVPPRSDGSKRAGEGDPKEKRARRAWWDLMNKRDPLQRQQFPGDVRGGVGFDHGGRTYGGKY